VKVTDAMVSAGAALSTTGRENDPSYREKVRRIIEVATEQGERDYLSALIEASRKRKTGDPIERTECAVTSCTCGYWHSCWCNKCGHVQAIVIEEPK